MSPLGWTAMLAGVALGTLPGLFGVLRPSLVKHQQIEESWADRLAWWFQLALVPSLMVGGLLADHLGLRETLSAGCLVMALALAALGGPIPYRSLMAATAALGLGAGLLGASSIVLLSRAFFPQHAAASLNLGLVFAGLGGLLFPSVWNLLAQRVSLRGSATVLALAYLVPGVLIWLAPGSALVADDSLGHARSAFSEPVLWSGLSVLLLYGLLEQWPRLWLDKYRKGLGFSEGGTRRLWAGFWLAFLGARLLNSQALQNQQTFTDAWVIFWMALLSLVCLGILVGTQNRGDAGVLLLIFGALLGPIVPTLLGTACVHTAERGTLLGTMLAFGTLGHLLIAGRLKQFEDRWGGVLFVAPTFVALALTVATMIYALV